VTERLKGARYLGWLAGLALLTGVVVANVWPAQAGTNCGGPYNTVYNPTDPNTGRGARVNSPGADVTNPNIVCGRVVSLFVHNSSWTDFVEIGYYEDDATYNCIEDTTGKPRILAYERNSTGASCDHSTPEVDGGDVITLSVADQNQDGYWNFEWDGNSVFQNAETMGLFNSGIVADNGERVSIYDSASANFRGLLRLSSSGWVNWSATDKNNLESDDPGYKGCKDSNTHTRVIVNSSTC
jgi:hypothetical protein